MKKIVSALAALSLAWFVSSVCSCSSGSSDEEETQTKTETGNGTGNGSGTTTPQNYTSLTFLDNYVSISSWSNKSKWNLANTHDPTVFKWTDGYYYMFGTDASYGNELHNAATGKYFAGKRSKDLVNWEYVPGVFDEAPDWILTKVNEYRTAQSLPTFSSKSDISWGYWAPCARVVTVNGETKVRMYYDIVVDNYIKTGKKNTSANYDGSWVERAFIGVMETTNPAGGPSAWTDLGYVLCSSSDKGPDGYARSSTDYWEDAYFYFNAIDPTYFIDDDGSHWMIYGSWHSGFALVRINPETGKVAAVDGSDYLTGNVTGDFEMGVPWSPNGTKDAPLPDELVSQGYGTRIFARGTSRWQPSEGPELVKYDGKYWLFFANDALDVPYQTRVVCADKITGPYKSIGGSTMTNNVSGVAHENGSINIYPILTHPYKFSDEEPSSGGYGSCYGWVGISHCAVFQDDDGNWYYMSQQRLPANVANNAYSNAIMMGGVRRIVWTPTGSSVNDKWPMVLPERYGGIPSTYNPDSTATDGTIAASEIPGTWQHINLAYSKGNMDEASSLTLSSDGKMSGALSGTWSFSESDQTLTLVDETDGSVTVALEREIDWEKVPRVPTIVYAGTSKSLTKTYWGKLESSSSAWTTSSDGNTISFDDSSSSAGTSGITIPAFSVTSSDGFTVSFKATLPSTTNDWKAKVLSYGNCYVTIPNLDPWNNTISASTLTEKNSYPTATGASLSNGLAYNSAFDGVEHSIKIVFSSDTIKFYLDGSLWVTYSSTALDGGMTEFVGYYVTALTAGSLKFNEAGLGITDLVISKGTD